MNDRDLRFVAHIDILGMSAIVKKDADEAWGMLSDLVAVRDQIGRYVIGFLDSNERVFASEATHAVTFSDTIVLFTKGGSDTELRCMIVLVAEIPRRPPKFPHLWPLQIPPVERVAPM